MSDIVTEPPDLAFKARVRNLNQEIAHCNTFQPYQPYLPSYITKDVEQWNSKGPDSDRCDRGRGPLSDWSTAVRRDETDRM